MWKWLLGAALCVASVGAMAASGQARDLNGDGVADALYDATHNQTWIDHEVFNGQAFGAGGVAISMANIDYGAAAADWRLPILFAAPPLSVGVQCVGSYSPGGNVMCNSNEPGDSEISRLAADFGLDPFSWVTGFGIAENVPFWSGNYGDPPDQFGSLQVFAAVGRTSSLFTADPYAWISAPAWVLADGDFGVAISAVPEPSTYALMLAGLLGMVWRRRVHAAHLTTAPFSRPERQ